MKIGNVELKHGIMLAPMAGFSDSAMREICHECGAEYSVTEMVSAKAVVYGDKKTARLARITEHEGAVGVQIFGSEPEIMAEAAARLSSAQEGGVPPMSIDINMGCPVPKIFKNGEGSALMKNPSMIYDIVKAVRGAITLPLTVKMRLGVDREHMNAVECALAAEAAGADAICVHGRTRVEMYSGFADMDEIAKVKNSLQIPLIANGDVCSYEDYLRVKRLTCADGVMIGRGAIGNPFIFKEIISACDGTAYNAPKLDERADTAIRQLMLAARDKGEEVAVREARGQIAHYFKGFRGSAGLRAEINQAQTVEDAVRAIRNIEK